MMQFLWKWFLRLTNPTCKIEAASIARNVKLENNVTLGYGSHVCASRIGKYTFINDYCHIDKNTGSIGRFCSIAYGVKIGLGNHPTSWVSSHPFAYHKKYDFVSSNKSFDEEVNGKAVIGNDVWIGANAIILAGINVGDGAIVGANALVTKDVSPYSIVVGTPATHTRYRFDEETVNKLEKLKWWNWSEKELKAKIDSFNNPHKLFKA